MLVGWVFGYMTFQSTGKMKGLQTGAITWSYEIGRRYTRSVAWPVQITTAILVFSPVMVLAFLSDINVVTFYNLELAALDCRR